MATGFVSIEQFEAFKSEVAAQYDQTRKLMTNQAVALERKLQALIKDLEAITTRKPDPTMIRDAWIRQVPKIRAELQVLQLHVARMSSIVEPNRKVEVKSNAF